MKLLLASLIVCLACCPGTAPAQKGAKGLRCVKEGYHAKIKELDVFDAHRHLNDIPGKFPKSGEMNVAAVILQLRACLAEEDGGVEVVFETNLSPEEIVNSLRKITIHTVHGYRLNEKQRRDALARSSCEDLLAIIAENAGFWHVIGEQEIVIGTPPKRK